MSRSDPNKRQSARPGAGRTPPSRLGAGSIRTGTLVLLVGVVLFMALLMVISTVQFVSDPAPGVRAGPMYVTLALSTGAALLMVIMALNASFLPFLSPRRAGDVHLVMWSMGITGVVTGILTVGSAASPVLTRLVVSALAFVFIATQNSRLARARAKARALSATATGSAGAPGATGRRAAPAPQTHPGSRQRRGGRKR